MFLNQWKKLKEKLSLRIVHNHCLICFKQITKISLRSLINKNNVLCASCLNEMGPRILFLKIENIKGVGLYPYNEKIQDLLFQYKGCYDIELSKVFFSPYITLLNLMFRNYIIVPIPSFEEADKLRGFNHVDEMAKKLKLKIVKCVEKIEDVKQANLKKHQREKIDRSFILNNKQEQIYGEKILLIDDVLTTGSTLKAVINLLKKLDIRDIKFVVMSYTSRRTSNFDERK